jgi:hypothetical protein
VNPGVRSALFRFSAAAYTALLITATHWPALEITGPVKRPDLYIHAGAFGLLTVLVIGSGVFGRPGRTASIVKAAAAVLAFAAVDELTQGIPGLRRTPALSDWVADAAGVAGAVAMCLLTARLTARRPPSAAPGQAEGSRTPGR